MNKKVFIKQDGTIPGHRIIEELERRGGSNRYSSYGGDRTDGCYYIENDQIKLSFPSLLKDYTELLYVKETDSFYENDISEGRISFPKDKLFISEGKYNIPDGYEATIEDGKVIVKKKGKWEPKVGDECYSVELYADALIFHVDTFTFTYEDDLDYWKRGTMFVEEAEAQVLCDKLNAAIAPIYDEIEKELEARK